MRKPAISVQIHYYNNGPMTDVSGSDGRNVLDEAKALHEAGAAVVSAEVYLYPPRGSRRKVRTLFGWDGADSAAKQYAGR